MYLRLKPFHRFHILGEIFSRVDNVWDAPLFEQFEEVPPPKAELTGSTSGRNLTVREQRQDGLFAEMFFELSFVDSLLGDINFDLEFHGIFIVL